VVMLSSCVDEGMLWVIDKRFLFLKIEIMEIMDRLVS